MGICASTEHLEQGQETDENIVYVMDEQGVAAVAAGDAASARKVASLFSQKGKKGPNQDSVILCQVLIPSSFYTFLFFLSCLCRRVGLLRFAFQLLLFYSFGASSSFFHVVQLGCSVSCSSCRCF
jgi:hypothetical protein